MVEEEPDKELIEAVRIGVKRLESLAISHSTSNLDFPQEHTNLSPQCDKPEYNTDLTSETLKKEKREELEHLNTLIIAGFMTSVIGSKASLDMLSLFRNMGWLSSESFNRISTALHMMPDKEGIAVDRMKWHEVFLLVIRKYERNPADPELILLVKLIEALSQTGEGIVELR